MLKTTQNVIILMCNFLLPSAWSITIFYRFALLSVNKTPFKTQEPFVSMAVVLDAVGIDFITRLNPFVGDLVKM